MANQIKAGIVLNYAVIGLNTLVGILYTPYMLRMLGQNQYGLYSLVASVISYLTIMDFGLGNAVIRYTARLIAQGKKREQYSLFGMFFIIYLVIGAAVLCLGGFLYFNVDTLFHRTMDAVELGQTRILMLILVINLAVTFPFSIFSSIITAYEDFVFQRVLNLIRIVLMTSVLIAVLAMGYKAIGLAIVQTIFNFAVLGINFFYCRYRLRIKMIFEKFNWHFLREVAIYSFWIFLNAIMDRIYWSTGQFVLGTQAGTVAVSIFALATQLAVMYMTFSTAVSGVFLPRITQMVTNHASNGEIACLFLKTGRVQHIIMIFILSGFILFGQQFVEIWAGRGYEQTYWLTLIFFGALYVPLIQNVGIVILQARNQMRFRCITYVLIAFLSLVGQIYFSRWWGATGCAWAVGAGLLLGPGLVINYYYHRVQHLDILRFWREIIRMTIFPALLVVAGFMVKPYLEIHSLGRLLAAIAIFYALYMPGVWFFGMNNYERELIRKPLRRIFRRHASQI